MTSLQQIKKWSDKYSFDEGELEIILRCHDSIVNPKDQRDNGSFLNLLSHSFPYVFFFLPYDEIQNRIALVENHMLPKNFGERFKKAIFPLKGTETETEAIEMLIQGVANCCKGDSGETLGIIFDCCDVCDGTAAPEEIIQLCFQLSICATVLISPKIDEKRVLALSKQPMDLHGLTNSLSAMTLAKGTRVGKQTFIEWGKKCVPHIGSTVAGFVHNLVFHGKSSHSRSPAFNNVELLDASSVFTDNNAGNLFAISCMSPDLGGKWRRILKVTSPIEKNCSVATLEKAMIQHVGPTIFVIKVDSDHLIGGVAESGWKFGYFLFEIEPSARIHHSKGATAKFFVRHNVKQTTGHGETLSGSGFFADVAGVGNTPELFVSEHFRWCKALFMDVPFSSKVEAMEVWGVEELREGETLKDPGPKKDVLHNPQ